jgi:large subunit ribosomal protein L2
MPTKKFKPMTPGTRFRSVTVNDEITRDTPEKSLLEPIRKTGGRNHHGHITSRRRGGGAKRQYRRIDFKRDKHGVTGRAGHRLAAPRRSTRDLTRDTCLHTICSCQISTSGRSTVN